MKKVNIKKVLAAKADKETKKVTSVRLRPSDKELLIETFGSVQVAVECLCESLKSK